ncbi:MAG: hypothetical protein DRO15_03640 [Thermoprotei archaeon]|nr:MAG: hypothetical protein DRO15_03640 [Thermoprotei archaeon]
MREELLEDFPALRKYIYLNTASIGLTPRSVVGVLKGFLESLLLEGTAYLDEEKEAMVFEELRSAAAKLLNCDEDEIAIFNSVTEALNSIAWGLECRGKIISTDVEFPTVIYPWARIGKDKDWSMVLVKSRNYLVDEEELLSVIDEEVRAICISHVEYLTGQKFDLRRIARKAHEIGALLIVDGIQAAGYEPINVKELDVDIYIAGSYKWLVGPMGAAIAYIRKELCNSLEPGLVGWRSVEDMWSLNTTTDLKYAKAARRFEYSTSAYEAKIGLGKSIEYLLNIGIDRINYHNMKITQYLIEELDKLPRVKILTPMNLKNRGSIITIDVEGVKSHELAQKIMYNGKRQAIFSIRKGLLRFSPHFYNDEEDIDEVLSRLKKALLY